MWYNVLLTLNSGGSLYLFSSLTFYLHKVILSTLYIIIGLLLLVKGGDYLVDGSVALAQHAKMSKMIIGLTVIGFGTSMPELLVSVQAAWIDNAGIAIGNVVGSNISNIALILGVSAIICPIVGKRTAMLVDIPFMIVAMIIFTCIGLHGYISRVAGLCMASLLVMYVAWQIRKGRKTKEEFEEPSMKLIRAIVTVILSFIALVYGANLLVEGASDIARMLNVSDRIIGLTIVAVGTSLPELAASVMAAYKKETDMALGNIIGSVSFNILSVIGISAAISPIANANVGFVFDYLLMTFLGFLLWLFLRTHRAIVRWEGGILFAIYIAYLCWTVYAEIKTP